MKSLRTRILDDLDWGNAHLRQLGVSFHLGQSTTRAITHLEGDASQLLMGTGGTKRKKPGRDLQNDSITVGQLARDRDHIANFKQLEQYVAAYDCLLRLLKFE